MTDENTHIGARAMLLAVLFVVFLFAGVSLFQIQVEAFQPPLIAYWFLIFAVFLSPAVIMVGLVPVLFLTHVLVLFATRYVEQHGLPVGHSFVAIMQTEGGEAFAYINQSLHGSDWLLTGVLAVWVGFMLLGIRRQARTVFQATQGLRPVYAFTYLVALSAIVYLLSGLHEQVSAAYRNVQQTAAAFNKELVAQKDLREEFGNLAWRGSPLKADFEGTTVLVIGESTSRHHLRLYGYMRETTPYLSSIENELLIQRDTISPHSYTIQSLTEVLSSANHDDQKVFAAAPSENILSAAKAAGIKTFWFSNQNKYGIWANLVSLLGQTADVSVFTRKSFGKLYHFRSYDHELLPLLDQALNDTAPHKLIVLHLYATHFPYCDFVPEGHRHFQLQGELGPRFFGNGRNMSKAVNCYDDAVRYVDTILRDVIARADAKQEPMLVAYISDHGEDPAGGTAHEIPLHRGPHIEIPFVVYANDDARKQLGDELDAFKANANKPFKSSDLYYTLLDVLIRPTDIVRHDRSLFSDSYQPYQRTSIASDDGPEFVLYDVFGGNDNKDYAEKARANLSKLRRTDELKWQRVWAHRVNTLGKLLETKQLFSGVEVDLVFSPVDGIFHVTHPPAPPTGLTLHEYLDAAQDKPHMGIWLDWKNAATTDLTDALAHLDKLDKKFSLRERSILELPINTPLERKEEIHDFDWPKSYYLPTSQIIQCGDADSSECQTLARKILERASAFAVDYLSFDYRGRSFVDRHAEVLSGYRLIGWDLDKSVTDHDLSESEIDPQLDIVLVNAPSLFHY